MKVVAIGGSPRINGNTNYLIDQALGELASRGIETEKIVLNEYKVGPCQAHDNCASFSECQQKDDGQWILEKFSQADGIILASPVYFGSISAQMKAFMDRNYFFYTHSMSPKMSCAGVIAVGGGTGLYLAVKALKPLLKLNDDRIVTVSGYASKPGDVRSNKSLVEEARKMGKRLAEMLT